MDEEPADPELYATVDAALREPHPIALLTLASAMVSAATPRETWQRQDDDPQLPNLAEMCAMFLDVGDRQTDALLLAFAPMIDDELLRRRIRRDVAGRKHPVPGWLLRLDQTTAGRTVMITEQLGDGDNLVVDIRLPGGKPCTIVMYIDHNAGSIVKDCFVLDRTLDEMLGAWHDLSHDGETEIIDLSPAHARARMEPAIERGAMTIPPYESESWPACRPLVEWMLTLLPEGGTGYVRPEFTDAELAAISDDFFGSDFGRELDDDIHRGLLESMLWFGTDYGPGDPLRWSPVSVEIILADWIPRKLMIDADELARMPELLRAFVRYSHHVRGIPTAATAATLQVIDECEPEYQQVIRTPRAQGPAALLERMGMLGEPGEQGFAGWPGWDEDEEGYDVLALYRFLLEDLAEQVGGEAALDRLDAEPLPDEAFDTDGIPDDILSKVAEVRDWVDRCAAEFFDTEFRTACRRLLSRVAQGDPSIFRRKGASRTAAAAVCWMIGRANDSFNPYVPGRRTKDVMAFFSTASASQRAEPMYRVLDVARDAPYVGDASLLVSGKRTSMIRWRDEWSAELDDE